MKVLLAAASCEPGRGSEPEVGWRVANLVAERHEAWVLCMPESREVIEAAVRAGKTPDNLHFLFCGRCPQWHPNRLVARLQSWAVYRAWLGEAMRLARRLHEEHRFDLTHHVTYATVRMASRLWRLPVPHVWGPVGGVGEYPLRFLGELSPAGAVFEAVRFLSNRSLDWSGSVRQCARNSRIVVAANQEAREALVRWRGSSKGVEQLAVAIFPPERIGELGSAGRRREPTGPLRLFAGGNLIGSKGVSFALEALAEAKGRGLQFTYRIRGGGPEMGHIRKRIRALGLERDVETGEALRGKDYLEALGEAHLYLLPSFRENAGLTMLEAMLAGAVPVVVDSSAQGEIVRSSGAGMAVPIHGSARVVASRLAEAICVYDRDRSRLARESEIVSRFVAERYSEQRYRAEILRIYEQAVA